MWQVLEDKLNSAIFLADGFKITLEIFFFYYPYSVLKRSSV